MSGELLLLITLIVTLAAWLVSHVLLVWSSLRAIQLPWSLRLLSLIPFATPVVAIIGGRRRLPIIWFLLLVFYAFLRIWG